jgi:hypothetical protein
MSMLASLTTTRGDRFRKTRIKDLTFLHTLCFAMKQGRWARVARVGVSGR